MTLQGKITAFLGPKGKTVDFDARRPLADMEDQADGQGPYISHWDQSLGAIPTQADGFTAYELHRLV